MTGLARVRAEPHYTCMDAMPLARELEAYKKLLPSLAADEGKFALIHGDDLVGVYGTYPDALKIGYEKFGLDAFMVKQIAATEVIAYFSRDLCPT